MTACAAYALLILACLLSAGAPAPAPAPEEAPEPLQIRQARPAPELPRPQRVSRVQTLSAPDILASTQTIAHAMGEADGHAYLNCLEGFQAMYALGVRVFEADLELTIDGRIVLRHDWNFDVQEGIGADAIPTREEFLAVPILGEYTPLSFRDLLLLMEEYPDICVITDTKYTGPETAAAQLRLMQQDAQELGLTMLFDRIVIQVYNRAMGETLAGRFGFPHYIYTLYAEGFDQTTDTFRELAAYCANHGIEGITMWDSWWDPAYAPIARTFGVRVYAHTVNDPARARQLLDSGVSAVYTDRLDDRTLREYTPPDGPEGGETAENP